MTSTLFSSHKCCFMLAANKPISECQISDKIDICAEQPSKNKNNFYLNQTHSMSHTCQNPYFCYQATNAELSRMGERVIEKTKCILEHFVFGKQQGSVCVGWEVCQGGGLQLFTHAEKLYFSTMFRDNPGPPQILLLLTLTDL